VAPPPIVDAGSRPMPLADAGATSADAAVDADASPADAAKDVPPADAAAETASARAPAVGEVVIVAALANPSGLDAGREWIEIASRSAEPLDLSGLHVADAAADVAVPAGVIDPGGRLVLGQSADTGKNGGVVVA